MINLDKYIQELQPEIALVTERQSQEELFLQYAPDEMIKAYHTGEKLTGKDGLRKKLAAVNLQYFSRAYLGHYFKSPSPPFHSELDEIWKKGVMKSINPIEKKGEIQKCHGCRKAIAAPRGHAKSTNFTFKDSLHAILYEYKHYLILLSDSSEQAENFLSDIKAELEDNNIIKEDFGDLQGDTWKAMVIVTSTNIKVEAIGSGKKIRGRRHRNWRPDLIVLDDVENDENVNTPEQRRKLESWFLKAVSKAGDSYTDIVYIGTILHYDSLLSKVLQNAEYDSVVYKGIISFADNQDLWDVWESIYIDLSNEKRKEDAKTFYLEHKEDMDAGTEVLWEEKKPYYDLMIMKIFEGEASFNSEIQNEPIDPDNATFQEEWFDFYDDDEPDFSKPEFLFIGANDPSLGKNIRSDTSSVIVVAKNIRTGFMYVVVADIAKRKPDIIINDIFSSNRMLKDTYHKSFHKFGIEAVQFQHFFAEVVRQKSVKDGEYLPIVEINSTTNKRVRIESLQPYVKNKYLKFSRKHKALLQQMFQYPMGKNDDGPDGLEMAVKLAIETTGNTVTDYKTVIKRALRFGKGAY